MPDTYYRVTGIGQSSDSIRQWPMSGTAMRHVGIVLQSVF